MAGHSARHRLNPYGRRSSPCHEDPPGTQFLELNFPFPPDILFHSPPGPGQPAPRFRSRCYLWFQPLRRDPRGSLRQQQGAHALLSKTNFGIFFFFFFKNYSNSLPHYKPPCARSFPRWPGQHSSARSSLPRNSVASSSTLDRNLLSVLRQL